MTALQNDELRDLGDRALRSRVKKARKDFDKLGDAQPSAENLERLQATADVVVAGEKELRSRKHRRAVANIPVAREMRDQADAQAARRTQTADAVRAFNLIGRVSGETLKASRLTSEQGSELLTLVLKSRREAISAAEQERWEELVAIAADDPDLFERERRKQAVAAKEAKLREQERLASLEQRGAPPPGSIILPGELTSDLVEARDDGLTYARLGVLSGVLLGLENHTGTLVGSRFSDGALVGASEPLRFVSSGDGSLEVTSAVEYLRRAELLSVERGPEGLRIGAGERITRLHDTKEGGETTNGNSVQK